MPRRYHGPKYERLRVLLKAAGDDGLFASEIAKKLDTKNPMSLVRELEGHGDQVERFANRGSEKGTRVVYVGRKWADQKPQLEEVPDARSAASPPQTDGHAGPSVDAADRAPTILDYTALAKRRHPLEQVAVTERPAADGKGELHLPDLDWLRRTGRLLSPEERAAIPEGAELTLECATCKLEREECGPCPAPGCGDENVSNIYVYAHRSDAEIRKALAA